MERKLDKYRIDWKDIVHGHFEVEASSSNEALENLNLFRKRNYIKNQIGIQMEQK